MVMSTIFCVNSSLRGWLRCAITLVRRLAVAHYYDVKIS